MRKKLLTAMSVVLLTLASVAMGQGVAPVAGPEVQKLSYLAGNWKLDGEIVAGVLGPGGKFTASTEAEMMKGGFFVVAHEHYGGSSGEENALSVTGWDAAKQQYTYYGFSEDGSTEISTGHATADGLVWTHGASWKGVPATVRYTVTMVSPVLYTMRSEISVAGKDWTLFLTGTARKGR